MTANQRSAFSLSFTLSLNINNGFGLRGLGDIQWVGCVDLSVGHAFIRRNETSFYKKTFKLISATYAIPELYQNF